MLQSQNYGPHVRRSLGKIQISFLWKMELQLISLGIQMVYEKSEEFQRLTGWQDLLTLIELNIFGTGCERVLQDRSQKMQLSYSLVYKRFGRMS